MAMGHWQQTVDLQWSFQVQIRVCRRFSPRSNPVQSPLLDDVGRRVAQEHMDGSTCVDTKKGTRRKGNRGVYRHAVVGGYTIGLDALNVHGERTAAPLGGRLGPSDALRCLAGNLA
jgi:hypothetical protein